MKIIILSDTHLDPLQYDKEKTERDIDNLLTKLNPFLKDADHIIHAGDVCAPSLIEELSKKAPISVVRGNMDEYYNNFNWPKTLTLEFEGLTIGVAHNIEDFSVFDKDEIKIFIFGHTHIPMISTDPSGVLFINPGSITRPRASQKRRYGFDKPKPIPSIAILEITDGIISSFIKPIN